MRIIFIGNYKYNPEYILERQYNMGELRDAWMADKIGRTFGINIIPRQQVEFGDIPRRDVKQMHETAKLTREINRIAKEHKLIELINYQQELKEQQTKFTKDLIDLNVIKGEEVPDSLKVKELEDILQEIKLALNNIGKIIKKQRKIIYELETKYLNEFEKPYEEYKKSTGTYQTGGPDLLLEQRKKREKAASSAVEQRARTSNRTLRKRREVISDFIKNTIEHTSVGGTKNLKVKKPLKKPVVKAVKKPLKKLVKKPVVKPAKKKVVATHVRK